MAVGACVDQLNIDGDPVREAAHASLENVRHAERLADFQNVPFVGVAVFHHAGAADHLEVLDLGQDRQQIVLNAVGEEGVLLLEAEVLKRKHGDALFPGRSKALPGQDGDDNEERADDEKIELPAGAASDRFRGRHLVGALEPFGRPLKDPRDDHGHRKTEQEDDNDKANGPIRNVEEGKDLRRDLDQEPGDDAVSRGRAIDIAPPELSEKVARVHGCFPSHNS